MAKKSKTPANPNAGTALANWDEDLARYAQEQAALEQMPGGNKISFEGGIISIAGKPVQGNTLDVVLLGSRYENVFYVGKYDRANPTGPVCFAFGKTPEEMEAHDVVLKKQNLQKVERDGKEVSVSPCPSCPQNAFGTGGMSGKGKACKNGRRLAFIAASDLKDEKTLARAEIFYARLGVMNAKLWAKYVKGLSILEKKPTFGVVTQLTTVPDAKSQFQVVFKVLEGIDRGLGAGILAKVAEVDREIEFPYQPMAEVTVPLKVKGKEKGKEKGAEKKTPRKKY